MDLDYDLAPKSKFSLDDDTRDRKEIASKDGGNQKALHETTISDAYDLYRKERKRRTRVATAATLKRNRGR